MKWILFILFLKFISGATLIDNFYDANNARNAVLTNCSTAIGTRMDGIETNFQLQLGNFSQNMDINTKIMMFTFSITTPYDGIEVDIECNIQRRFSDFDMTYFQTIWSESPPGTMYQVYYYQLNGVKALSVANYAITNSNRTSTALPATIEYQLFNQVSTLVQSPGSGVYATLIGYGNGTSTPTIPANTLSVGSNFRIINRGIFSSGILNTISIRLNVGGTQAATTNNAFGVLANVGYSTSANCKVVTVGESGTMACLMTGLFAGIPFQSTSVSTITINTTTGLVIDLQVQFATGGNSISSAITTINIKY
jgi:hypothetical protein